MKTLTQVRIQFVDDHAAEFLARLIDRVESQHLPAQVVDHGTGYLAAFGAQVALARRAREGGSYLVRVSLAQTGRWVDALGRVNGRATADLALESVQDLVADADSPYGRLRHVVPAARFNETPAFWSRPTVPLGTHQPAWPA